MNNNCWSVGAVLSLMGFVCIFPFVFVFLCVFCLFVHRCINLRDCVGLYVYMFVYDCLSEGTFTLHTGTVTLCLSVPCLSLSVFVCLCQSVYLSVVSVCFVCLWKCLIV